MEDEEGRNAVAELVLLRLVVKSLHTYPSAEAAADGSHPEEGGFGYSPAPCLRFPFVYAISTEGDEINCCEEKKWK